MQNTEGNALRRSFAGQIPSSDRLWMLHVFPTAIRPAKLLWDQALISVIVLKARVTLPVLKHALHANEASVMLTTVLITAAIARKTTAAGLFALTVPTET